MAMPKLKSVPINMYSVSFRSLEAVKSPNLNTDFAVIKNPTASQWSTRIKIKTNSRSNIPIYFPASLSDSLSFVSLEIFHLENIVFIIMEVGTVKNAIQIVNKIRLVFKVKLISVVALASSGAKAKIITK